MKHQQLELRALIIIWLKTKSGKLWRTDFEIFHCTRLNALGYDTGFSLVPSDNLLPRTPIPIQPSAGVPHPSLLACFYLG